jgi:hypothetical protein
MSYRVVSCRVASRSVVSCRVLSCRVASCRVAACRGVAWRAVACRGAGWRGALLYPILSHQIVYNCLQHGSMSHLHQSLGLGIDIERVQASVQLPPLLISDPRAHSMDRVDKVHPCRSVVQIRNANSRDGLDAKGCCQ